MAGTSFFWFPVTFPLNPFSSVGEFPSCAKKLGVFRLLARVHQVAWPKMIRLAAGTDAYWT